MTADEHYEPIPRNYPRCPWPLAVLKSEPDFPAICEKLRVKATTPTARYKWHESWRSLYQSLVLPHPEVWKALCLAQISAATAQDALDQELELFSGSSLTIAFSQPDIARAFLLKAEELGGFTARDRMRWELYHASSPESRSWSAGVPDPEHDYVQSAALQAAKANDTDPTLGPFYRWVVEREEKEKEWHREMDRREFLEMEEESED